VGEVLRAQTELAVAERAGGVVTPTEEPRGRTRHDADAVIGGNLTGEFAD
jgi:hypothetical protein